MARVTESEIRKFVDERVRAWDEDFVPGKSRIPLSSATWGTDEVMAGLDTLLSGRVTFGAKCRQFEDVFSRYCRVNGGVFLNSGSSANLLAYFVLTNPSMRGPIKRGSEVVVPAVSWSTTVFPIADAGLVPVLVDADLDTLNLDPAEVEKAVGPKTAAVMPVHVLGNPPNFKSILGTARDEGLRVVEDACEAHGSSVNGRMAGSFGDLATFSYYFSHHMTTIEGGMLVSKDERMLEIARILRAHGYSRDAKAAKQFARRYPQIDSRFLFVNRGFNFRPTELQAAFGLEQMGKLPKVIDHKRDLAAYYRKQLAEHEGVLRFQKEQKGHRNVYLGFSILVSPKAGFSRQEFVDDMESGGIETRPVIAGNMAEQPAMAHLKHRKVGKLPRARQIMRTGLYMGAHVGIGKEQRQYVVDRIDRFIRRHT